MAFGKGNWFSLRLWFLVGQPHYNVPYTNDIQAAQIRVDGQCFKKDRKYEGLWR